jgi:hypothetical protein
MGHFARISMAGGILAKLELRPKAFFNNPRTARNPRKTMAKTSAEQ